jgi:hypothetical protein
MQTTKPVTPSHEKAKRKRKKKALKPATIPTKTEEDVEALTNAISNVKIAEPVTPPEVVPIRTRKLDTPVARRMILHHLGIKEPQK